MIGLLKPTALHGRVVRPPRRIFRRARALEWHGGVRSPRLALAITAWSTEVVGGGDDSRLAVRSLSVDRRR